MDKSDKIALGICGAIFVGGLIIVSRCFSRIQYYQGRIDARNEMTDGLKTILDDIEKIKFEKKA